MVARNLKKLLEEYYNPKRERMTTEELYTLAYIVAERRKEIHKNHLSQRVLSENYEEVGLMGELVFGEETNLRTDLSDRLSGDKYDFMTIAGPIDVKTSARSNKLYVEAHKAKPNFIYVLGKFTNKNVTFKGWEWGYEMIKQPIEVSKFGIRNHTKLASRLRPMNELYKMLNVDIKHDFLTF